MTLANFGNMMKFLNLITFFSQRWRRASSALLFLLLPLCVYAETPAKTPAENAPAVGEISLVLGSARLESATGERRDVTRGAAIHVNDRIVTGTNGHVHIHFEDGALVSVRPDSRLQVQRYDYDRQAPERSSVRFTLEEGITRSISGDAARSARERFRLNTPVAAIGVRGTDFVVSATATTTRAMVNEGIIVLAPYSAQCSADAFGPCQANAVELSDESLQILALDESAPLPRLVPTPNVGQPDMMREEVELIISARENGEGRNVAATAGDRDVSDERATSLELIQEAVTTPQISDVADNASSAAQLNARDLIWGRFLILGSGDVPADLERITVPFAVASERREATVGNGDFGLFRRDLYNKGVEVAPQVLSFRLNSAQAFYNSDSGVMAMDVNGGRLDIDLVDNRFATELNLDSAATGVVDFSATGGVFDGGFFHSRTADQRIAGAISLDGREAGFFFERQLEQGDIHGLTLWDRR